MPNVRLIIFDLGRVLVKLCDGWEHACEVARLPIELPARDEARKAALHEVVCAMETSAITTDEFCRRAGGVFDIEPRHVRSILDVFLVEPFEGVVELIDELNASGVETACLSNTNTEHWNQIFDRSDRCGLPMDRLRHHFASHLLRLRKPDEAIYRHVERTTGFSSAQVVFFDDMPENIDGASKCGWRAHQILRDVDPVRQMRGHLAAHGVLVQRAGSPI